MKTNVFPLFGKSLSVLAVFCLTAFVAFGAASNSGFLKSAPYMEINPESDAALSQIAPKAIEVLDGIVAKVKTKAEAKIASGGDAAYNAYLDTYLDVLNGLDDSLMSDPDYDTTYRFLFEYLYPRVNAMKKDIGSASALDRILQAFDPSDSIENTNSNTQSRSRTTLDAAPSAETDLCAQEGLDNIDETNFSVAKNVVITGDGWSKFSGLPDGRDRAYKMDAGQSYSFPMEIPENAASLNWWSMHGSPYGWTFVHVWKVSEKKCDFNLSKNDPCNGMASGGENEQMHFSVNGKESSYCQLIPGKKYYFNFRWLRRSDIVDASSGKLKMNSFNYTDLSSMSVAALNDFLDENFNTKGDSCLPGKHPWQWGPDDSFPCMLSIGWSGVGFPSMPKFTPQEQAEIEVLRKKKMDAEWVIEEANRKQDKEQKQLQEQRSKDFPNCGTDWQSIGTLSCLAGKGEIQTFTTCRPPAGGYGYQVWGSEVDLTWKLRTGRPCSTAPSVATPANTSPIPVITSTCAPAAGEPCTLTMEPVKIPSSTPRNASLCEGGSYQVTPTEDAAISDVVCSYPRFIQCDGTCPTS